MCGIMQHVCDLISFSCQNFLLRFFFSLLVNVLIRFTCAVMYRKLCHEKREKKCNKNLRASYLF